MPELFRGGDSTVVMGMDVYGQVKGGPGDGVAYEGATVLDAKQVFVLSVGCLQIVGFHCLIHADARGGICKGVPWHRSRNTRLEAVVTPSAAAWAGLLQDARGDAGLCQPVPVHHDGAQPVLLHAAAARPVRARAHACAGVITLCVHV